MKIKGNNPVEREGRYSGVNDISRANGVEEKDNTNKTNDNKDIVNISGRAGKTNQHTEIGTDRVEAIKRAIDTHEYNLDLLKVAGKILDEINLVWH